MISETATRVEQHTASQINELIHHETQKRIAAFESNNRNALITQRLKELDSEWDVERTLQTNFAILSLVGLALATKVNKRWFALALGVPAFMVQHALQGWCPPLPVLRRLGLRTAREINEERFKLRSMRGDFSQFPGSNDPDALFKAVRS